MKLLINLIFTMTGATLASCIIYYFAKHPEKIDKWLDVFNRVANYIAVYCPVEIRKYFDRRVVASSIHFQVNNICNKLNTDCPGILPHSIKIEWVHKEDKESFMKNNDVIVRLKKYANQDRNITEATLAFLNKGFLPRCRSYLDESLLKGCEYKIASKIFCQDVRSGAYDYFFEKVFNPAIEMNENLKSDVQLIEDIDSIDFFNRVFLSEVIQTGKKLLGTMATKSIKDEIREFAIFLQIIANKSHRENVPLLFIGKKIKAGVVLVAKSETIHFRGIIPYLHAIEINANKGCDTIYVSGWGEEFIKHVIAIKHIIHGETVDVIGSYSTAIQSKNKGILLVCQPNQSYLARQRALQQEVIKELEDIIPEVKSGEIDIVSIARIEHEILKIAVRMSSGGSSYHALSLCVGDRRKNMDIIKSKFPNEYVTFIRWSDNVEELIKNALYPLRDYEVDSIEITDESNQVACVKLKSGDAERYALGKRNANLRAASELTGWVIDILISQQEDSTKSPDEVFQQTLIELIPELKKNEIKIERSARIVGVGARTIVKYSKSRARGLASKICYGDDYDKINALRIKFPGEMFYFHEWSNDLETMIKNCLFPIKPDDIYWIDIQHDMNTIDIKLNEGVDENILTYQQKILCERIIGWRIEFVRNNGTTDES